MALVFQCLLAAGLWHFLNLQLWLAWLISATIVVFGTYGIDKLSAGRGWRRTPEWAIWLLILAGGVAGGWCGQILFRHKTRKASFWIVLILATCLYGVLLWINRGQLNWKRS